MRLQFSKNEYLELQRLISIINDQRKSPGQRRIAMNKFHNLYNQVKLKSSYGDNNELDNRLAAR